MISDDFEPAATGVGTHIQCIAKELAARGHQISVITSRRRGEATESVWHDVKVYRTFTLKLFGFYQALPSRRHIRKVLQREQTRIVHYHYLSLLLLRAFRAATELGLHHLYTYHMTVDHLTQPLLMRPLRGPLFRLHVAYCNRFERILAPSDNLAKQIKTLGIRTPIHYLSNPVMLSAQPSPAETPEDPFVVLYVGRLNPEKNLPYLIHAFAELVRTQANCRLEIVGSGNQRGALEQLIRQLGLGDKVQLLGFVAHADLPRYYQRCHVFVLPSLVETQGLVAMEAMRFSKPVIVTHSIVSAKELVDEGRNGFIVDPDSPEQLTDRLLRLKIDSGLRRTMGRAGLEKSEGYTPERIVDALERHYYELLNTRTRPDPGSRER
jgi:glycosyltransferase involved in cell wall biosynthesis